MNNESVPPATSTAVNLRASCGGDAQRALDAALALLKRLDVADDTTPPDNTITVICADVNFAALAADLSGVYPAILALRVGEDGRPLPYAVPSLWYVMPAGFCPLTLVAHEVLEQVLTKNAPELLRVIPVIDFEVAPLEGGQPAVE